VLIWFVVLAPVLVAEVFRSPMIDYRLVALGAVLPLAEVVIGANVAHTLLGAVLVMTLVMFATQQRRLIRRRMLGVPIGLFVHLVLDGSWTRSELFWWPAFGFDFGPSRLPEFDRPIVVGILLELAGVVAAWWAIGRYDLADPENRQRLVRTGQLDRSVLS
jgi:hypothetical protein